MEIVLLNGITQYNIDFFNLINHGLDNNTFDFIMPLITDFGSVVAWGVVCVLLFFFGGEKGKRAAILGLAALLISNVIVLVLKSLVAEPRPFIALKNVDLLVKSSGTYSFPSGHTASSFAAATIIGLKYHLKIKNTKIQLIYPLIAFAAIIGFSRIYIGVHYPLDVLVGAIIGSICALIVLKYEDRFFLLQTKLTSKRWKKNTNS